VLLVVGGLIAFFVLRSGPGDNNPPPTPPPEDVKKEDVKKGSGAGGTGGSVQERLPPQVGDYRIQHVAPYPQAIDTGATDAVAADYATPNGERAQLILSAFPSPEQANQAAQQLAQNLTQQQGYRVEEQFRSGGRGIYSKGRGVTLLGTNQNLFVTVGAAQNAAASFYEAILQSGGGSPEVSPEQQKK